VLVYRQWLFILEGVPSVALGIALAIWLPESPLQSRWLTEEQKQLFSQDVSNTTWHGLLSWTSGRHH
jgi:hypothetical protein